MESRNQPRRQAAAASTNGNNMLAAALSSSSTALLVAMPSATARASAHARAPVLRMDEDEEELNFDMGLLKLPRLVTPQQASFEAYRKRRQEDSMRGLGKSGAGAPPGASDKTPLGMDPVEGDPVDLSAYDETGMGAPVTEEQTRSADEEFRQMSKGGTSPKVSGWCASNGNHTSDGRSCGSRRKAFVWGCH